MFNYNSNEARKCMVRAMTNLYNWAQYAPEYFQKKHNLDADIDDLAKGIDFIDKCFVLDEHVDEVAYAIWNSQIGGTKEQYQDETNTYTKEVFKDSAIAALKVIRK